MTRAVSRGFVATVVLGACLLAAPAASAQTTAVNCASVNLQTKIDNAPTGSTLLITGTCHGQFTIGKGLTLKGNPTATLDGDSGGTTLTVNGVHAVHLRSLVVTGGQSQRGAGIDQEDGGLLTLDHVALRGNQAVGASAVGGGIFAKNAVLALRGSTVANNHAVSSGSGLAVAQGGAMEIQNGSLTISKSTLRGNQATAVSMASLAEADGGAVFAFETTTAIISSHFADNVASSNAADNSDADAGAVRWQQDSGDLSITDSSFTNNQATAVSSGTHGTNAFGGALTVSTGSGASDTSLVKFARVAFDGNQATATGSGAGSVAGSVAQGGAAYLDAGSQALHLSSVRVLNSMLTATGLTKARANGAGIFAIGGLTMTGSTVTGNTGHAHSGIDAGSASGGGIETHGALLTSISTSTISGNSVIAESDHSGAGAGGGGIITAGAQRLTLKTSTVSGNSGSATSTDASGEALGGGLDLNTTSESDAIVNSTIAGNSVAVSGPNSDSAGGAIEIANQGLHVRLSTIVRNSATASNGATFAGGGGLDVESGNTQFEGVVLALNTAATGANCIGTIASNGFNVIGDLLGCSWGAADTDQTNVAAPKLGLLRANGGPTQTIALLAGSPAIDTVPTVPCHQMAAKDQRGIVRPQGTECDAGAFEKKPA